MVKVTKVITTELNEKVIIKTENFYQTICNIITSSLSEEIQSNREYLFVITIKRRILQGVHVINIGSARESVIDYRALIKYALDDNADEVIVCHNHLLVVDNKPEDNVLASDQDLFSFSNIFCLFSLMNIYSVCCIVSGDNTCVSFYYPHGWYSFVNESGWKKKKITKKNGKTYIEKIPYVKSGIKEVTFNQVKFTKINDKKKKNNNRRFKDEKVNGC